MDDGSIRDVLDADAPDRELTPGFEADLRTLLADTWRHGDRAYQPRSPSGRAWLVVAACLVIITGGVAGIVALRPASTSPAPSVLTPTPSPAAPAPSTPSIVTPSTVPRPTSRSDSTNQSPPPVTFSDAATRQGLVESNGRSLPDWLSFELPRGDHDVDLGVVDGIQVRITKKEGMLCVQLDEAFSSCTGPSGAATSRFAEWGGMRPLDPGPSFRDWLLPADVTLTVTYDDDTTPCELHRTAIPNMADVALWTCRSADNLFGRNVRSTFTHDDETFVATSFKVPDAVAGQGAGPATDDGGVGGLLVTAAVAATLGLVVLGIVIQSVAYRERRARRSKRRDAPPTTAK